MSVRARLARGSAWLLAARVLTNLLAFSSTLFLARILVPGDFGLVAIATTIMAILTAVTDISLASALIHHPDPTEQHLHTAWTLNLARGVLIGLALALAAVPIARLYAEPRLVEVVVALSLTLVLNGLANPRAAMAQRELIFSQQFTLDVAQKGVTFLVQVTVALAFRNYWALVAGLIAGQAAGTVVSYVVLPFRPRFSRRHGRELLGFSIWLTLGQIVNTVNWRFDQLLIGYVAGRTPLGYYTVGDGIAALPTRETMTPLTAAVFPALRRFTDDRAALGRAYQQAQALVTALILPLGVGMALIADPLVRLVMGEQWLPAIFMMQMLASVYAVQTIGTLAHPLAMATGDTRLLFVRDLQSFCLRIPFLIVGMILAGVPGIVYARVAAGTITIVFNMRVVSKVAGLSPWTQLRGCWRSPVSALAMAAAVAGLRRVTPTGHGVVELIAQIAAAVALGAATYAATHLTLWVAAGRPAGPEAVLTRALARFLRGRRLIRSPAEDRQP